MEDAPAIALVGKYYGYNGTDDETKTLLMRKWNRMTEADKTKWRDMVRAVIHSFLKGGTIPE